MKKFSCVLEGNNRDLQISTSQAVTCGRIFLMELTENRVCHKAIQGSSCTCRLFREISKEYVKQPANNNSTVLVGSFRM